MSDPSDRSDDPDDVTLWAGRLRSWPANPPSVEQDDDTVRSGSDGGRERDDHTVQDDDTVRSSAPRAAEAQVRSTRDEPDDATVRSRRTASDDDTIRSPTTGAVTPSGRLLDDTVPGARTRRPIAVEHPAVEHPAAEHPAAEHPAVEQPSDALAETTRPRRTPDADGDTHAGSRRARRAEAERSATPPEAVIPGGLRAAHVPAAAQRIGYAPRADEPVRVERSTPVERPRATADPSTIHPRSARDGVRRALILAVVVVVLLGAAVTGAVLLLG